MPLTPGTRLGSFLIEALLGAGGMGEVYKAKDTRLDRTVAIKILPSADPDLKARFEREAKAIAGLQHQHICTLYDVGHEGSTDYLVLEYLVGETLADRLARGPLKLEDALKMAIEVFDVEILEPTAPYPTDYAVSADGQRFLVNTVVDQPARPALTVILNWTAALIR
jgi:serine/threonine protein kinase